MVRRILECSSLAFAAAFLLIGCSQAPQKTGDASVDEHASPSLDEAKRLAADKGALVLVDFYAPT